MTTLFVSDLHLDTTRPRITELFLRFVQDQARQAEALYVLGDLFEAWVGDDNPSEPGAAVAKGLRAIADAGVPIYFLRGNRDFLLGADYARHAGMRILPDPCVAVLHGRPTLLMHGDLLCTEDAAYQAFRRQVRDPAWQVQFLAQPLQARLALALQARAASREHQQSVRAEPMTREDITDVSAKTVEATLARYGIDILIHGHTHRPAIHSLIAGGRPRTRIVLGDWYEQGSVLRLDVDGVELSSLPL